MQSKSNASVKTSALSDTQSSKQLLLDKLQFSVCIRAVTEKKRKDYAFWRQFNEKPSIIPGCPGRAVTHTSEMRERTKGFFKQAGLPMKTTMKVMISSTCRPSSDLGECCPTYSISSHKSSTKYSCRHRFGPPSGLSADTDSHSFHTEQDRRIRHVS